MKNAFLLILFLVSCNLLAQRKPKIKGNRTVTEVRQELPPFRAIELSDDLEVNIREGNSHGYSITADDNLVDILKFKVEGETLFISSFYNITSKKKLEITVSCPTLEKIVLQSGELIGSDLITSDILNIRTLGNSKIRFNARASYVELMMENNSSGELNFDADSLDVKLMDKSDVSVYGQGGVSSYNLDQQASARLEGTADTVKIRLAGNADLKAAKYEAAVVLAELSTSAKAELHAFRSFELHASGSSRVYLYGNPEIRIHSFNDRSELLKRED